MFPKVDITRAICRVAARHNSVLKLKSLITQRSGCALDPRQLSEGLASKGVQINDMTQTTYPAEGRQMMISWEAELGIPADVDVEEVRAIVADMAQNEKKLSAEISE